MKNLFLFILAFQGFLIAQDTFSIVAIDTATGEVGSAGASCINSISIPGGCAVISHIQPGRGAIHTQAQYLLVNKQYGINLMQSGKLPQEILDSLILYDASGNSTIRQYGAVAIDNGQVYSAAFTGSACLDYKNHLVGPNYSIQGNILSGQAILDSMEARFLRAEGELACRLMEALEGANVPGADARCLSRGTSSLSSFLRVARPTDTLGGYKYDINVPYVANGIEPIDTLRALFALAGGCAATTVSSEAHPEFLKVQVTNNSQILQVFGEPGKTIQIGLYNTEGKQFHQESLSLPASLNLQTLNPGLWIYRIHGPETGGKQGKFIILGR